MTTKIEWARNRDGSAGETWNPIRARNRATGGVGHFCVRVSDGCERCYAARMQRRFNNPVRYAAQDRKLVDIFLDETVLFAPLGWRKPRTVFVCSMTDLFGEWVPDEWIDRIFAVMALSPQHTFQVLTKRPERMRAYMTARSQGNAEAVRVILTAFHARAGKWCKSIVWPLPNVWLGVSAENRRTGLPRTFELANTPAAVRFWSLEPLLEDLGDLTHMCLRDTAPDGKRAVDWVILGGESGPGARPMHPDWARSARDQCADAGVAFFFKQWGEWVAAADARVGARDVFFWPAADDGTFPTEVSYLVGKKRAGRMLDGQVHDEMPAFDSGGAPSASPAPGPGQAPAPARATHAV